MLPCRRSGPMSLSSWSKRPGLKSVGSLVDVEPTFMELRRMPPSQLSLDGGLTLRLELGSGIVLTVARRMIALPVGVRVMLCTQTTDMRKSCDGLITATTKH